MAQVSKTMCQEISDLREGQLLALCRQPGVGAVIYLLFGAVSVEVSMENAPWRAICQHCRARVGEELEKRGLRVAGFSVLCAHAKTPKFPRMVSARAQHLQRTEEKTGQ